MEYHVGDKYSYCCIQSRVLLWWTHEIGFDIDCAEVTYRTDAVKVKVVPLSHQYCCGVSRGNVAGIRQTGWLKYVRTYIKSGVEVK
jgi:hypothetical protein